MEEAWSFDTCKDEGKERRFNKKVLVWVMGCLWVRVACERSCTSCRNKLLFMPLLCLVVGWELLMETGN